MKKITLKNTMQAMNFTRAQSVKDNKMNGLADVFSDVQVNEEA